MKWSVHRLLAATCCLGALSLIPSCVAGVPDEDEGALGTTHRALTTTFAATDDTVVNSFSPTVSYSTRTFVTAGDWTNSGTDYQNRSYLKFDLSAIPKGATIKSATLELSANTDDLAYGQGTANGLPPGHSDLSGSNSFLVRRVTSAWMGSTTTWQSAPSVTTTNEVTAPASTSPTQNYSVDVASLVQDMVNDPAGSFGLELRLATEQHYREVTFASSEHPNALLRPRLVIDYVDSAPPVPGFADLHVHMMAEEAHGGRWLYGSYTGPLTSCDGGVPNSNHGRARQDLGGLKAEIDACGNNLLGAAAVLDPALELIVRGTGGIALSELLTKTAGTKGDGGLHLARRSYPGGWPSWDTVAHEQTHTDWLKKAHDGGLNLFVMSAVSSEFMCKLLPPQNGQPACDEMADAERQIQMAHALDAANAWVEIALTPADARRIIGEGKLAMVLSIEVSELFGNGSNWLAQFDHFYDLGVRTLQPVHETDNRFAGAALHNPVLQLADYVKSCHVDTDCGKKTLGFDVHDVNGICENVKGLTPEGVALAKEMMSRGMLIDAAHLSNESMKQLIDVTEANDYYPLYISHGHPQEIMGDEVAKTEKATPAWVMEGLRRSGGMFGLRTFHNDARQYEYSQVENTCAGSSRSLAQAVDYLHTGIKIHAAFGSDFNGMVQQTRPRFGEDACSATEIGMGIGKLGMSFEAEAHCEQADQRLNGPAGVGSDFDTKGLAHIGLLPDLLHDLKSLKTDTSDLEDSAENFIRMWERAQGPRSGPADPALDVDTSGIAGYTPIKERFDDYPTKCGRPYCSDYQALGGECRFDAECESGQCANLGLSCGLDKGKCVCNNDADCGAGNFCNKGLPGPGDNECVAEKADHESCSRDDQCQSGSCGGCATLVGWCYVPDSKALGESCVADRECLSDRCSADCYANPTGKCLCDHDDDCTSTQYCGWGFNSGQCQEKKGKGKLCASGRECSSGKCSWGFCKK